MAISAAPTIVFEATRQDSRGMSTVKAAVVYQFVEVDTDDFTYPISLAGAKSVWVSNATSVNEVAEYYIPGYSGGEISVSATPIAIMPSTSSNAGMDITAPSAQGAGFIGGGNVPPALSVKQKGTTESTFLIHITY